MAFGWIMKWAFGSHHLIDGFNVIQLEILFLFLNEINIKVLIETVRGNNSWTRSIEQIVWGLIDNKIN